MPGSVGVQEGISTEFPQAFTLQQNRPNPFNPVTVIQYDMTEPGLVILTVYDLLGREIKTLAKGFQGSGIHEVSWNGTDSNGSHVSSGTYLYTLQAGGRSETKRMTFVK